MKNTDIIRICLMHGKIYRSFKALVWAILLYTLLREVFCSLGVLYSLTTRSLLSFWPGASSKSLFAPLLCLRTIPSRPVSLSLRGTDPRELNQASDDSAPDSLWLSLSLVKPSVKDLCAEVLVDGLLTNGARLGVSIFYSMKIVQTDLDALAILSIPATCASLGWTLILLVQALYLKQRRSRQTMDPTSSEIFSASITETLLNPRQMLFD